MKIINNNRKYGSRFSRTNMSSKTEEEGLEEYNNFRDRYYDYDSSSNSNFSDSFYEDDSSDDDEVYYRMRGDFTMERVMPTNNRVNSNSNKRNEFMDKRMEIE